jgi:parallel beta-helix repeat protein
MRGFRTTIIGSALIVLGALGSSCEGRAAPATAATAVKCTKTTSPHGRSVQRFVDSLRPGQVGCLLPGTYSGDVSIRRGGTRGKPIVLTSATSREARVQGTFWVDADDVVVKRLRLDGSTTGGAPSPQINGNRVVFRNNDVSNGHTAICFIVGGDFAKFGFAESTVIAGNRIHDCGRLPRTGHDHGIYLEGSRGARVVGNVIYGNADWGIQFYPEADDSYVAHNVIDGNGGGVIIAGESAGGEYDQGHSSDHNRVELNVIANSSADQNIAAFWGGPVGVGNVVRRNCVWNGADGNIGNRVGLVISRTVVADPRFVNRKTLDFRMRASSRCRRMGAGPLH